MSEKPPFFIFTLPECTDSRGSLFPVELDAQFPLNPVKRVYFLKNTPAEVARGAHCHHIEEEVFVCIAGKCRALIDEDGKGKQEIWLDNATKAIFVGTKVWHEFDHFSSDAVLLCFSSTAYMPGTVNYETDYEKFSQPNGSL
ncbi:MAG: FdtA/QdtA family cupin domain-containing protein [Candidatus Peregrinibacteria bacterium]